MRGPQPWRTNRARVLRANETTAEKTLWKSLRRKAVGGARFVRQVPIGPYFADFCCRELKIVVEVDGATHHTAEQQASDAKRQRFIEAEGYVVVRISNRDVFDAIDGVVRTIEAACLARRGG